MKRFKNLVTVMFISPEFLVLIVIFGIYQFYPPFLKSIGTKIQADAEVWRYLPTLTFVMASLAFTFSSKLRAPLVNKSNKILYDWPLYQLFVDRVIVSLLFAIVCAITALVLWVYGASMGSVQVGAVFLGSTISVSTTAITMLLAHQKLMALQRN
ncbi:MAG: hypothetical protein GY928_19010 [Colwellia sp.]|nr:hypothetical protein [Colwellia sp.]